jgi:GT2 family glycosyltransferase
MVDINVQPERPADEVSDLRERIKVLERCLEQELNTRNALELELSRIKNSLAWMFLLKCRKWREKLLAEGSLRLKFYEFSRDCLKVILLFKDRASSSNGAGSPHFARKALSILRTEGIGGLRRELTNEIEWGSEYAIWIKKHDNLAGANLDVIRRHIEQVEYPVWVKKHDTISGAERAMIKRHIERLPYKPVVSVVMPVYNTPERWLRLAIESVRNQLYPKWELCIADDASSEAHVGIILRQYQAIDSRIKVHFREENGHISAASNTALAAATGEFVTFLDHDDELSEHALYMVAVELNAHRTADLVYSDEDKIDETGRRYDPYFKPDWNPALFMAQNYICHLTVYRSSILKHVGGLRMGYEGAQDWDLAMRVSEAIPDSHIRHTPFVLYHWRAIPGSTAMGEQQKTYATEAQRKTLQSHFDRIDTKVELLPVADRYWRVQYPLPEPAPKVTLIVPTRNGFNLLQRCVESIYEKTTYRDYDLIIVDNQSDEPATLTYLAQLERERGVRILRYDAPFNYAAINNFAVQNASGELIGLLNNDLEVIAPGWLEEMASYAVQPDVGAVGAMLYFPNNTIQHAGVILGIGCPPPGVAVHAYKNYFRGDPGQASRALLCQNMSAVTGACLVVRRKLFEEVGGLDEKNLPIAFNDIDFCLRLREKGYKNLWTPYAELYHHESASRGYETSPEKLDRFENEKAYMKRQWGKLLLDDPAYNPNLALGREPFMLDFPPRVTKPWLIEAGLEMSNTIWADEGKSYA